MMMKLIKVKNRKGVVEIYNTINYDDTYCFVIDYSAQNSFGGVTRSEAYIWIEKETKEVYFSDFK